MKPKKSRLLYQEIAEQKDLSKHLVENLLDFYYKNVRSLLSELYHPRINITGLGVFVARKNTVNKAIPRFKKYLENHDTSTYSAYYNKKMLEEKLEFLYSIKDQIEEEHKRKEMFINNRNKKNV
jgi:nucleoid DNA-binding protein|tara:strand:+ start:58 stop:429 length:372 start_codon:yes stop_codon:yes gene_type:complete